MMVPRKTEIDAVVAVLEKEQPLLDDEGEPVLDETGEPVLEPAYADATAFARAIVSAVGNEILKRGAFLITAPDGALCWGPYYTELAAVTAWTEQIGPATGGAARIVRSFPWSEPGDETAGRPCVCGHRPENHVRSKSGKPTDCGVVRNKLKCACAGYDGRKN